MSTIANAQRSMGFTPAMGRPRCANCNLRDERWQDRAPKDTMSLYCKQGGFGTTAYAVCSKYQGRFAQALIVPIEQPKAA
jgi:hypothetical protein